MMTHPEEIGRAFIGAMEAEGVRPAESILHELLSGKLIRFKVADDRRPNGWAVLHLDGRPAGSFGCNKRQIKGKWKADQDRQPLTRAQKAAYAKEMATKRQAAADAKLAEETAAAERARSLIARAKPAEPSHPYLQKKRLGTAGLLQLGTSILVPMRDPAGDLWNLQFIGPDGDKLFLKEARTKGLCWSVEGTDERVFMGEGVATMGRVHRASGGTCYAAFSAGNLVAGALLARLIHPDADITICADDDAHLVHHPDVGRNIGLDAAHAAAAAIGGRVAVPQRRQNNG